MRKALAWAMLAVMVVCSSAFAEATFDQIQGLIKQQDYGAAVQGLNIIIQNHPRSAKAYYAMSQAQAGIGNQAKAKEALDMARGLDPSLKFAPSGSVEHLKEAIQPQTKKIEAIESHTLRNVLIILAIIGGIAFLVLRKRGKDRPSPEAAPLPIAPSSGPTPQIARGYGNSYPHRYSGGARPYQQAAVPPPVQHTTVVNNGGSGDLVTGMVLGSMMHGSHEHRTVVEREYVREVESPRESRSSSWEDTPSKSSSWDSGSSSSSSWDSGSSSSSSWGDSSSSSSSSSWDSGSSSDSSSSSWD